MRLQTDRNKIAIQNLNHAFMHCDTVEGVISYYGFESVDGSWLLKQVTDTTTRYCFGRTYYAAAFIARATLTYGYPSEVFSGI